MSVKGLVERYDSLPASPLPILTPARRASLVPTSPEPASARRARFIKQPRSTGSSTIPEPDDASPISPLRHPLLKPVTPIHNVQSNDQPQRQSAHTSRSDSKHDSISTTFHTYPPSDGTSTSTLLSHSTPVPATVLFARKAAPLYLPKLDAYLSRLPIPDFSIHRNERKSKAAGMFPPMDVLASSGYSLDDLAHNSEQTPGWRNRSSILETAVNIVLSFTGSSALATFYSLQGIVNTLQVFALILSTISAKGTDQVVDYWRQLWLGTIPNILALNVASTVIQSLIFLLVVMSITAALLYYFYRSSVHCDRYRRVEGLQDTRKPGSQWGLILATFFLTVIYLPLSTIAVHVLVWSQDLWIVPNPYLNATSLPPVVPPLGPAAEFRDPLDFCWTSTMRKNEINFAPVVIVLAAVVVLTLTLWFPIALQRVIRSSVPKVDAFTELGRPRNKTSMDTEYHRLLERDTNPFAFLYIGFRREWGTYQSIYLFAKLSTLIIIAVLDPDNCLFRTVSRSQILMVRQILLLVSTIGFFIAQCFFAPFLDPINNASEWVSRLNYVATAALAFLVVVDVPGKDILNTYVLYIIYIITYGLGFYFLIINRSFVGRIVKRLTRRIDFSIDIFSPRLDLTSSSPHTKRRIWQESLTAIILTDRNCRIPKSQTMMFAESRDTLFPPYLLNFEGTPGERHVENLKILRELGSLAYYKAVALMTGPESALYYKLGNHIQHHFVGPDCYWRDPNEAVVQGRNNFFGNAWWIPFPPTLVLRYDTGPYAVIQEAAGLQEYISQNSSHMIRRRKEVRLSLRALEGQIVYWPYEHVKPVGSQSIWHGMRRYTASTTVHYQRAVLRVQRHGHLVWKGMSLGSGFKVELHYGKRVKVEGEVIGLGDDFELTSPLARFLSLNRDNVMSRIHNLTKTVDDYRLHHRIECERKAKVLTYGFLTRIYDCPQHPCDLVTDIKEPDPRVQNLLAGCEVSLRAAYDRFEAVSSSQAATWWHLFWDDLWRRNHDTVSALDLHAQDFSPYYPTSIAYQPLPRAALESFLIQRGLLSQPPKRSDTFHVGMLNKMYMRLNEAAFRGSSKVILFNLGHDTEVLDMESVDYETMVNPSSLGTGPGTAHNDSTMIARPNYRWEGLLQESLHKTSGRPFLGKLWAWLGLSPYWKYDLASPGLAVHVRLENGRYVPIEEERGEGHRHSVAGPGNLF